jgi:hypothetical protein
MSNLCAAGSGERRIPYSVSRIPYSVFRIVRSVPSFASELNMKI